MRKTIIYFFEECDFLGVSLKNATYTTKAAIIVVEKAIIAREYGIPGIVGTKYATKKIKDGDMIEINANEGFVRILNQ